MDILQRQSQKILVMKVTNLLSSFCLALWVLACTGETQQEAIQTEASSLEESNPQAVLTTAELKIPETLDNFDKSYQGALQQQPVQINLRRYGRELSGTLWAINQDSPLQTLRGTIEADGRFLTLEVQDSSGNNVAQLKGQLKEQGQIVGTWKNKQGEAFEITLREMATPVFKRLEVDDLEIYKNSPDGKHSLNITYPQLMGIQDANISNRVNMAIENYFESATMIDSIGSVAYDFEENVKFEVAFLGKDLISICKHHHLSKDQNTQLFDDSHGININFKKAKVYQIRDLFKPNAISELNQIILARINKACNHSLDEEILASCKVGLEESTSFSLSKDKITFHLTERLPHQSRGCGYVRITYKDLAGLFNPSGPLAEMYQSL